MTAFDLPSATAILSRTPAILDAWLRGLPEAWLDARPEGPESFSPRSDTSRKWGRGRRTCRS